MRYMGPRRILLLTNRIPFPLNDGGALAMHAMLEGYHNAGWQVYLLAMNASRLFTDLSTLPALYNKIEFSAVEVDTEIKWAPALRNFLFSTEPNHAERFFDQHYEKKLVQVIDSFDPELIQLESVFLSTYIPVIRKISKAVICTRLHNIEYQIWQRLAAESDNSIKRFYLKNLSERIRNFELSVWKQADVLLPITAVDEATIKKAGLTTETYVVPFGIDMKTAPVPENNGEWEAYHIGAMDWMPNAEAIKWFIEAVWPDLHQEIPGFRFSYAGRNMPGAFKRLQPEGVSCAGEVQDAEAFARDKRILVVPLHSGGGIRVKILEAMARNKIVVSTTVGMQGIDQAVPGTHFLEANDKDGFIEKIRWVLENKLAAEAIGKNSAELVRKVYNRQLIMQRLVRKLNEIAESRHI